MSHRLAAHLQLGDGPDRLLGCSPAAMRPSTKARVGATRLVLEQTVTCKDYVAISELQSKALIVMVEKESWSNEEAAAICGEVTGIKWAMPEHMNSVLGSLVGMPAGTANGAKRARRNGQNFLPISNYFSSSMWTFLTSTSPDSAKLSGILSFAANMGMRTPSEPTLKWLASLWQVCCCNDAQLAKKSDMDKRVALMSVKSSFATMKPKLQDPPVEWVEALPDEPSVFMGKCKRLWAQGMKSDHPGLPLIDMKRVSELDMTYGCRGGRTMSHFAVRDRALVAVSTHNVGNARLGCEPMERMAAMFMESMENMLAGQQRMIEMTMNPQQRAPRSASLLGHMLEDRPPHIVMSPRRRQPLALPPPQLDGTPVAPRQPFVEELPDSPQQQAAQAALEFVERQPPAKTTIAQGIQPGAAVAVPEHISSFLDALTERKDHKKAHKKDEKARKKAGKGAMPDAAAGCDIVMPLAKNKKKKNKNKKSKSHAKPKTVATAKTEEKPATKATKAKAASSSSKGAGKGKAAKRSKKHLPEADLILGCAKCRWSATGCGQCRSESFNGHRWNISRG